MLKLHDALLPSDLAELRHILAKSQLIQGAASGKASLKNNLQSAQGNPGLERATQKVVGALMNRRQFTSYTLPRQVTLMFNRYDVGMFYKSHMDAALMGGLNRQPLRADVSFTLFLNDPADYDGGELVIQNPGGALRFKETAGTVVVYPANMLHNVEEVTRGHRLAAVGWAQSMVREASRRELLYDLDQVRHDIVSELPDSLHQERLDRIKENLVRAWAEV